MTAETNRKPLVPGDFGFLEYLESEWERAARLEAEEDRRRALAAREAGLAAVEGELVGGAKP